jgi:hypothetical protein
MEALTPFQVQTITITERVNSGLSLVGIFFVILTYIFDSGFNKPINRLIFFASFGNMGTNVATMIGESALKIGATSPLCQLQAFFLQMFLGVDAYWAFCMAINVSLVFFHGYTVEQLRSLDVRYLLACYGLSFVPALVFIFIDVYPRGRMYGDALIWCWITPKWDFMRIVFLHGIVW